MALKHITRTIIICSCFCSFVFGSLNAVGSELQTKNILINIAIPALPEEIYPGASRIIQCKDTHLHTRNIPLTRVFAELVLICRALEYGGLIVNFQLIGSSGYQRAIRFAKNGAADIIAETILYQDIEQDKFYVSDAIIAKNEFYKGLYTTQNHLLQSIELKNIDFSNYAAAIEGSWLVDKAQLEKLTMTITTASSYESIFRMLKAKRADFTLLEFTNHKDLIVESEGIKLYPIKGIKIALDDSRHLIIPKSSSYAFTLKNALNKGIQTMRVNGEIAYYYELLGTFNPLTQTWREIP